MSIVKHEGLMQVTCDSCPASYRRTYAEEDFKIMVEEIKVEGWTIARAAGNWTHTCADCSKWADRRLI